MIRNNGTGKYLQCVADSSASSGFKIAEAEATGYEEQLWYIYKENTTYGVYYRIKNVKTGLMMEVSGKIPVTGVTIDLVTESSPNKAQEYAITENNGIFQIFSRCSGNYLLLNSTGSSVTQARKNSSNNQNWTIERVNKYFSGSYNNLKYSDGNMKILNYYVHSSIDTNGWTNILNNCISRWNNYSNYTEIRLEQCTNKSLADIYITSVYDTISNTTLGETTAYESWNTNDFSGIVGDLNSAMRGTIITLNEYSIRQGTNNESRTVTRTLTHELGHALQLKHPFYDLSKVEIEDVDMSKVAYSVMNQGGDISSTYPKVSYTVTYYDRVTLRNKWYQY